MPLKIKPASDCKFDELSLGEIMLRLDPGEGRIHTTRWFQAWEGGGEYNVARGLRRCFGLRTAVVTTFAPQKFVPLKKAGNFKELTALIDQNLPTKNIFYAIKIEGRFSRVKARSVPRQTRPYPPLAQAVEKQAVFNFKDVEGTILGFRCPVYIKGVNVPGYHLHFLTKDRRAGGHVLDCSLKNVTVQIDPIHQFTLVLPKDKDFYRLDLDKDKSKELKKVEK